MLNLYHPCYPDGNVSEAVFLMLKVSGYSSETTRSGEHRPPACSIRLPAECLPSRHNEILSMFAASCRELQASPASAGCSPNQLSD
jgi:hypothetical protein